MSWLDALILGIVQGLTEFLPISSDGHLSITEKFLAWRSGHSQTGEENLFFVVPTSYEQRALEASMTTVDTTEFLASKRANPESASHVALAYRDLETLEQAVRAVRELDRVNIRVFRAKRGHDDVDARMDGSDVFGGVDDEAFVDRTVQVFVHTDLVSTSLLCLGQTIELDYVFG